jgi:hypothetical protein
MGKYTRRASVCKLSRNVYDLIFLFRSLSGMNGYRQLRRSVYLHREVRMKGGNVRDVQDDTALRRDDESRAMRLMPWPLPSSSRNTWTI